MYFQFDNFYIRILGIQLLINLFLLQLNLFTKIFFIAKSYIL